MTRQDIKLEEIYAHHSTQDIEDRMVRRVPVQDTHFQRKSPMTNFLDLVPSIQIMPPLGDHSHIPRTLEFFGSNL